MHVGLKSRIEDGEHVTDSPVHRNAIQAHSLLRKLTQNWPYRAQIKKNELDEKALLDDRKDDFLIDLLPFKEHPLFLVTSDEMKKKILTCGWLAYNEKTVDIEAKIITPACMRIIYGEVPGLQDIVSTHVASQTLVDEAYHVLLVNRAIQLTKERRNLLSITLPESNLISKMREFQRIHSEKWQKTIIHIVTAIVSEVFISDYLKLLSNDTSIQPFNRMVVDIHRRDELSHSSIFKSMAKCIYSSLSTTKRDFFMYVLPKPVTWFANLELDVWHAMLDQIGFPNTTNLINDCKGMHEAGLLKLDYSGLVSLAQELGIYNTTIGMDSFYQEGLME